MGLVHLSTFTTKNQPFMKLNIPSGQMEVNRGKYTMPGAQCMVYLRTFTPNNYPNVGKIFPWIP